MYLNTITPVIIIHFSPNIDHRLEHKYYYFFHTTYLYLNTITPVIIIHFSPNIGHRLEHKYY